MYGLGVEIPSPVTESPFVFSPSSAGPVAGGNSATGVGGREPVGRVNGSSSAGTETRREIAAIVREVAVAVSSQRDVAQYAAFVVDRIYRATAAGGVVLWRYETGGVESPSQTAIGSSLVAIRRCGLTTDQSVAAADVATHRNLVAEIIAANSPVVVPPDPTSGQQETVADHIDQSRNPMTVPVAIVPVSTQHPLDYGYAVEVILDDETPPTAWKPYLRFISQIADLAGQFFVVEHLRRLTRIADYCSEITSVIGRIAPSARAAAIREQFVDALADRFDLRRVAWLQRTGDRTEILAVSHCEKIDQKSSGVRSLISAAETSSSDQRSHGCFRIGETPIGWVTVASDDGQVKIVIETDVDTDLIDAGANRSDDGADNFDSENFDSGDFAAGKVNSGIAGEFRQVDPRHLIDPAFLGPLASGLTQTASLTFLATRLEQIPLGRFWAVTPPRNHTRRVPVMIGVSIIAAMLFFFPMPQNVLAPITLEPSNGQTIACTRDCIVDSIEVVHGQSVVAGQVVARLRDPTLEDRRLELLGRRSVLFEQRASVGDQLVDPSTPRREFRRLEDEQLLLETQLAGVDESLAAVNRMIARLTITSRHAGVVDAWRAADELPGLPLRRGDHLMRIIADDSSWKALASVPSRRIGWLHGAQNESDLRAEVSIDGSLASTRSVSLDSFGAPVQADETVGAESAIWVAFELAAEDRPSDPAWRAGAPGRVMIHCGEVSLGRWLAADMIDWTQQQCAAWLGIWRTS